MKRIPLMMALFVLGGIGVAHESWFVDRAVFPVQWSSAFAFPNLWFVVASLVAVIALAFIWRARGGRDFLGDRSVVGSDPGRIPILYAIVPAILGVHIAVSLLILGVTGFLFVPAVHLEPGWMSLLGLAQVGIGLSLFYGGLARLAAVVLIGLWLVGTVVFGPVQMLESAHVLGFAVFFLMAGRGPIAVDRLLFPRLEPPRAWMRHALTPLRVSVGLGFVVVAFVEKLANVPMGLAFLDMYPLNVTSALGVPISDPTFLLMAGSVELMIGLLLVFGIFVRETILLAWLPFNVTLTVLDWTELVGHLPIYGVMAVLLVWAPSGRDAASWVAGLRDALVPIRENASRMTVVRLFATGIYSAQLHVGEPEAIATTRYGWALVTKVALVLVILGIAALNRWRFLPSLRRDGPSLEFRRSGPRTNPRTIPRYCP